MRAWATACECGVTRPRILGPRTAAQGKVRFRVFFANDEFNGNGWRLTWPSIRECIHTAIGGHGVMLTDCDWRGCAHVHPDEHSPNHCEDDIPRQGRNSVARVVDYELDNVTRTAWLIMETDNAEFIRMLQAGDVRYVSPGVCPIVEDAVPMGPYGVLLTEHRWRFLHVAFVDTPAYGEIARVKDVGAVPSVQEFTRHAAGVRVGALAGDSAGELVDVLTWPPARRRRELNGALARLMARQHDESKVNRHPAGTSEGGRFAPKGAGGGATAPPRDRIGKSGYPEEADEAPRALKKSQRVEADERGRGWFVREWNEQTQGFDNIRAFVRKAPPKRYPVQFAIKRPSDIGGIEELYTDQWRDERGTHEALERRINTVQEAVAEMVQGVTALQEGTHVNLDIDPYDPHYFGYHARTSEDSDGKTVEVPQIRVNVNKLIEHVPEDRLAEATRTIMRHELAHLEWGSMPMEKREAFAHEVAKIVYDAGPMNPYHGDFIADTLDNEFADDPFDYLLSYGYGDDTPYQLERMLNETHSIILERIGRDPKRYYHMDNWSMNKAQMRLRLVDGRLMPTKGEDARIKEYDLYDFEEAWDKYYEAYEKVFGKGSLADQFEARAKARTASLPRLVAGWQDQPRHPAGTSDGGRWTKGGGGSGAAAEPLAKRAPASAHEGDVKDAKKAIDGMNAGLTEEQLEEAHLRVAGLLKGGMSARDVNRVTVHNTKAYNALLKAMNRGEVDRAAAEPLRKALLRIRLAAITAKHRLETEARMERDTRREDEIDAEQAKPLDWPVDRGSGKSAVQGGRVTRESMMAALSDGERANERVAEGIAELAAKLEASRWADVEGAPSFDAAVEATFSAVEGILGRKWERGPGKYIADVGETRSHAYFTATHEIAKMSEYMAARAARKWEPQVSLPTARSRKAWAAKATRMYEKASGSKKRIFSSAEEAEECFDAGIEAAQRVTVGSSLRPWVDTVKLKTTEKAYMGYYSAGGTPPGGPFVDTNERKRTINIMVGSCVAEGIALAERAKGSPLTREEKVAAARTFTESVAKHEATHAEWNFIPEPVKKLIYLETRTMGAMDIYHMEWMERARHRGAPGFDDEGPNNVLANETVAIMREIRHRGAEAFYRTLPGLHVYNDIRTGKVLREPAVISEAQAARMHESFKSISAAIDRITAPFGFREQFAKVARTAALTARAALLRLIANKAYDPNQPRDPDGKWTDTGAGGKLGGGKTDALEPGGRIEHVRGWTVGHLKLSDLVASSEERNRLGGIMSDAIDGTLGKMGFAVRGVKVVEDPHEEATTAAGMYDPRTNMIHINVGMLAAHFARHGYTDEDARRYVASVVRHEVAHAVWNSYTREARDAFAADVHETIRGFGPKPIDYPGFITQYHKYHVRRWTDRDSERWRETLRREPAKEGHKGKNMEEVMDYLVANETHSMVLERVGAKEDWYYSGGNKSMRSTISGKPLDEDELESHRKAWAMWAKIYRKHFGSTGLEEAYEATTASLRLTASHQDQPRAPAGTSEGGQWVAAGQALNKALEEREATMEAHKSVKDDKGREKWWDDMNRINARVKELEKAWAPPSGGGKAGVAMTVGKLPTWKEAHQAHVDYYAEKKREYGWDYRPHAKGTQERYGPVVEGLMEALEGVDITIPGLRVNFDVDSGVMGNWEEKTNTITLDPLEIAEVARSPEGARALAIACVKHEFGHAVWQRLPREDRDEWVAAVRAAGPMSQYDEGHRESAREKATTRGWTYEGDEEYTDSEFNWHLAAEESHNIALEAIGADEDLYYSPRYNSDMEGVEPEKIAKWKRNRRRLTKKYVKLFGHLGIAENFARFGALPARATRRHLLNGGGYYTADVSRAVAVEVVEWEGGRVASSRLEAVGGERPRTALLRLMAGHQDQPRAPKGTSEGGRWVKAGGGGGGAPSTGDALYEGDSAVKRAGDGPWTVNPKLSRDAVREALVNFEVDEDFLDEESVERAYRVYSATYDAMVDALDRMEFVLPEIEISMSMEDRKDWKEGDAVFTPGWFPGTGGIWLSAVQVSFGNHVDDSLEEAIAKAKRRVMLQLKHEVAHALWSAYPEAKKDEFMEALADEFDGLENIPAMNPYQARYIEEYREALLADEDEGEDPAGGSARALPHLLKETDSAYMEARGFDPEWYWSRQNKHFYYADDDEIAAYRDAYERVRAIHRTVFGYGVDDNLDRITASANAPLLRLMARHNPGQKRHPAGTFEGGRFAPENLAGAGETVKAIKGGRLTREMVLARPPEEERVAPREGQPTSAVQGGRVTVESVMAMLPASVRDADGERRVEYTDSDGTIVDVRGASARKSVEEIVENINLDRERWRKLKAGSEHDPGGADFDTVLAAVMASAERMSGGMLLGPRGGDWPRVTGDAPSGDRLAAYYEAMADMKEWVFRARNVKEIEDKYANSEWRKADISQVLKGRRVHNVITKSREDEERDWPAFGADEDLGVAMADAVRDEAVRVLDGTGTHIAAAHTDLWSTEGTHWNNIGRQLNMSSIAMAGMAYDIARVRHGRVPTREEALEVARRTGNLVIKHEMQHARWSMAPKTLRREFLARSARVGPVSAYTAMFLDKAMQVGSTPMDQDTAFHFANEMRSGIVEIAAWGPDRYYAERGSFRPEWRHIDEGSDLHGTRPTTADERAAFRRNYEIVRDIEREVFGPLGLEEQLGRVTAATAPLLRLIARQRINRGRP